MTYEYNAANDAWERGHAYPNDASPGRAGNPRRMPESGCGRTQEPCDGCQQAETEDLIRRLRDKEMAE